MTRARRGLTLVEVAVATLVVALLAYGTYGASHSVTRAFQKGDLTLDRVAELTLGAEKLVTEIRDARDVLHPPVGAAVARLLVLRTFDGEIVSWRYSPAERKLLRATHTLAGAVVADPAAATNLDGVQFGQPAPGLVSYGLFAGEATVLGAAGRKNQ